MKKEINQLIQLQELLSARAQQQQAQLQDDRLEQLNKSIASMMGTLPDDLRPHVERLQRKDLLIIAPLNSNACAACGMALPPNDVLIVKAGRTVSRCPSCSRLLYYDGEGPRHTGRHQAPRDAKAVIERYSGPELMIPRMKADTMEDAVSELAELMERTGYIDKAQPLIDLALKREAIVTTALEGGLAFPHVRGVEGGGLTLAAGLHPKGFPFDPESRQKTHLVFFIVIPTAASAFYLRLLAGLTHAFDDAAARKTLLETDTPANTWRTLVKLTRKSVK